MKKQNSDKNFTKLDDYLKCKFFKSNKTVNNRFKSINVYKNKKLEILIRKRKSKNKAQNIFELINLEDLLLNHYKNFKFYCNKSKETKSKNENIRYIKWEEKALGKGAFGICYKFRAIDKKDMNFYAGKIIKKEKVSNNKKSLLDEINIQKQFKDNPKVVKVKDYFEDDENVYIILELCENKSLLDYLEHRGGKLSEIEVKCFIFQLLQGLKCLHNKMVIHRDLKPNNLLLDSKYELKIGDFGLIAQLNNNDKEGIKGECGTYNYMAPEIFKNNGKGYSFGVDIWSVGIIMYQLLTGKLPFNGENKDVIKNNILSFQPENLDISKLSEVAADLIKQILVKDPKQRPGINQIIYHYFFHDIEFPKYITKEILKEIEKEEKGKKEDKGKKEEEVKEKLKMKLYNLIIDDIPEIEYENIKNYVIKESVSAYKNYITYFHVSSSSHKRYYEFNNEMIGMAFENNENGTIGINMIYNKETKIFYHIIVNEINEDNNENDEIQGYTKEEVPEKLKKYSDLILTYYDLAQKKKKNIKVKDKDENPSIKEQNSFSKNSQKSEQNSISNENSIISQNKISDKSNLIYVRKLISSKSINILFLSDNTIEAIFGDKTKILMSISNQKIEIIDKDNKINVVSSINALKNSNIDFTKRLKCIKKIIYKDLTKKLSENGKIQINNIKE